MNHETQRRIGERLRRGFAIAAMIGLFGCGTDSAPLAAWLSVETGQAAIHADGEGAAHPIATDSLIWSELQAKLLPSDGAADDYFGRSTALSGDTALMGVASDDDQGASSGSAYVFVRSGGVWTEQAKLLPSDGAAGDLFGRSVALAGDTALVGAPTDDDQGADAGSAYVLVRSGAVWIEQAKLLPNDGEADHNFGWSVALSGDTALVGTPEDDDQGFSSGSAYVLVRSGGVWTEQAKLLPSDGASSEDFGWSVALSGDTALVGAKHDEDQGSNSGSVYVFVRSGAVWTEQAKLLPSDVRCGGDVRRVSGRLPS
jgi:hypothetical protein